MSGMAGQLGEVARSREVEKEMLDTRASLLCRQGGRK